MDDGQTDNLPYLSHGIVPMPDETRETGRCIMYSANQLNDDGKTTLYPLKPTIKALGAYIQRCNKAFGEQPEMIAVYKNRKFHAYYLMQEGKLVKQGTLRLSEYIAI